MIRYKRQNLMKRRRRATGGAQRMRVHREVAWTWIGNGDLRKSVLCFAPIRRRLVPVVLLMLARPFTATTVMMYVLNEYSI